jgi:hypothetical protein
MVKRLRTIWGVDDDLQDFAQDLLNRPRLLSRTRDLRWADGAMVAVIAREGQYQAELCTLCGGVLIPDHVHPQADTIEVGLFGAMRLVVNGRDPFDGASDDRIAKHRWTGVRINSADVHGGRVPPTGAMFLSVQRWAGPVLSVLTDYRGALLGPEHARLGAA